MRTAQSGQESVHRSRRPGPDGRLAPSATAAPPDLQEFAQAGSSPVAGRISGEPAGPLHRYAEPADPLGGSHIDSTQAGALGRLRGQGSPLPADLAAPMSRALGADLDRVRIHTGREAHELSRSVQAVAFTHGSDIYFGAGRYAPGTPAGLRLLAHEVAHTVQPETGAGRGAAPVIGRADDPAESQADRMADGVLQVLRRRTTEAPDGSVGGGGPAHGAGPDSLRRMRATGGG